MSVGFEKTAVTAVHGDWAVAEQFNLALEQLANGRREHLQVEGQYARSKIAWKVANYAEVIRYRTVALADGAAQNWNSGNILCAALCARAVVETVAQLLYVKNGAAAALKLGSQSPLVNLLRTKRKCRPAQVIKEIDGAKEQNAYVVKVGPVVVVPSCPLSVLPKNADAPWGGTPIVAATLRRQKLIDM